MTNSSGNQYHYNYYNQTNYINNTNFVRPGGYCDRHVIGDNKDLINWNIEKTCMEAQMKALRSERNKAESAKVNAEHEALQKEYINQRKEIRAENKKPFPELLKGHKFDKDGKLIKDNQGEGDSKNKLIFSLKSNGLEIKNSPNEFSLKIGNASNNNILKIQTSSNGDASIEIDAKINIADLLKKITKQEPGARGGNAKKGVDKKIEFKVEVKDLFKTETGAKKLLEGDQKADESKTATSEASTSNESKTEVKAHASEVEAKKVPSSSDSQQAQEKVAVDSHVIYDYYEFLTKEQVQEAGKIFFIDNETQHDKYSGPG